MLLAAATSSARRAVRSIDASLTSLDRRESPAVADQHAHADGAIDGRGEMIDLAVAHFHVLLVGLGVADVGVAEGAAERSEARTSSSCARSGFMQAADYMSGGGWGRPPACLRRGTEAGRRPAPHVLYALVSPGR